MNHTYPSRSLFHGVSNVGIVRRLSVCWCAQYFETHSPRSAQTHGQCLASPVSLSDMAALRGQRPPAGQPADCSPLPASERARRDLRILNSCSWTGPVSERSSVGPCSAAGHVVAMCLLQRGRYRGVTKSAFAFIIPPRRHISITLTPSAASPRRSADPVWGHADDLQEGKGMKCASLLKERKEATLRHEPRVTGTGAMYTYLHCTKRRLRTPLSESAAKTWPCQTCFPGVPRSAWPPFECQHRNTFGVCLSTAWQVAGLTGLSKRVRAHADTLAPLPPRTLSRVRAARNRQGWRDGQRSKTDTS